MNGYTDDDAVGRLAQTFVSIQQHRMSGLPFLNPRLEVACIGFRPWDDALLGVLLTPWFMNLVLLPGSGGDWPSLRPGDKLTRRFPSGDYEFILGDERRIGRYLACSLFSPVFEFEDQGAALATAEAVMTALMDEANRETADIDAREVARIWHGGSRDGEDDDGVADVAAAAAAAGQPRTISRRDLICGRLAPSE